MLKRLRESAGEDSLARYDIKPLLLDLTRAKRKRSLALLKAMESSDS